MKSFIYIALGFFIGQGAMFLAQTHLLMSGEMDILSNIGIGLGLLSLLQWVCDLGGVFLIPRYMSSSHKMFLLFLLARFLFAFLVLCLFFLTSFYIDFNGFYGGILYFGYFVIFFSGFNLTGSVDYLKLNKKVGVYSGLCWFFSAVALILFKESQHLSLYVGLAYVLGLVINNLIQIYYVSKKFIFYDFSYKALDKKILIQVFKEGVSYNLSFVASQSYGRFIPLIIESHIGTLSSALFIYVRNITNVYGQFVMFARRVEYNKLLGFQIKNFSLIKLIIAQKFSLLVVFILFLVSIFAVFVIYYFNIPIENKNLFIEVLTWLSIVFISFNFSSMLSQYLVALGYVFLNSITQVLSIVIVFVSIFLFIDDYGLYSIFLSEFFMHVIRFFVCLFYINKISKKVSSCHV